MPYAFDTLSYAKRLRDARISQGQAEAHAEAAREFVMGELVTKTDLQAVKVDLLAVKADLLALKADLQAMKAELQTALDTLSLRLTVRLGVMLATGLATSIGLIAAIIKL
jgi:outer membrane protein TolC